MANTIRNDATELSVKLNPSMGTTNGIVAACEKIVRLSREHGRLAEHDCNRELTDDERKRYDRLEDLIQDEVDDGLPLVNGERIAMLPAWTHRSLA